MYRMKSVLLSFLLSVFLVGHAQVNQDRCGTFDVMKFKEQQTPGYLQQVRNVFNQAQDLAQSQSGSRDAYDTIYNIRCVFHVVYQNVDENIPDSVIYSQIEVLNEDYRRLNADSVKTRGVFLPVAADARIQFQLATTDPDGNPTNGITRTVGNPQGFLGFSPFDDNVKSAALGGKDPWPTDRYLNIWVCSVLNGFGVLGYAYPPDNAPNWPNGSGSDSAKQGVVLHYPVVGRNFSTPIDATVAKGRSAVHEIGHYLGLRHIWGDGDCTEDDGIADTPDADAAHQQTCDTASNSCTEASSPQVPDMIENYMDYSDDRCLNMFTLGQIGIMRSMLQTSRAGIADRIVETSIKETDFGAALQVFPNPTKDMFEITFPKNLSGDYSIEVYNTIGERIFTRSISNKYAATIDIAGYAAGVYYVQLTNGNQTAVKKIIKN
jgi:hypothetical protein